MPLVNEPTDETPDQRLAREARTRLAELSSAMLLTYGNLMNYQHNNGAGVTADQFHKALSNDAKDFKHIMGQLKRMLLRMNPALKPQLDEMAPKKTKKAAK